MSEITAEEVEIFDDTGDGVPDDQGEESPPPTLMTWIVRLVSVALIGSLIGYLVYLSLRPEVAAQFDVIANVDRAEQRDGAWVLPVDVLNTSTESMASVVVEIEQGNVTRSFTVTLMGEGERAIAEVRLPERPTADNIVADVTSYQSP